MLRLRWPLLVQPTDKGHFDARGIDLLAGDAPVFEVAIQCKGHKVNKPGAPELKDALASIEKFSKCEYRCQLFLLVDNREARDEDYRSPIGEALGKLVLAGKCQAAEFWSVDTLLQQFAVVLWDLLLVELRKKASTIQHDMQSALLFGEVFVPTVPAGEREISIVGKAEARLEDPSFRGTIALQDLVAKEGGHRFTLLTGPYGSGKTTATLHSVGQASLDKTFIYVPCIHLDPAIARSGTTKGLLNEITAMLLVNAWADNEDIQGFIKLAAAEFGIRLRQPEAKGRLFLILDGLDENRAFDGIEGLRILINALAEFKASIILTTRREHFARAFPDIGASIISMPELTPKFGPRRPVRVVEIEPWTDREAISLVSAAHSLKQAILSDEQLERLGGLLGALEDGTARTYYGDLVYHPLYLQFILEDVTEGGVQTRTRVQLLQNWIHRKFARDVRKGHADALSAQYDVHEIYANVKKLMMEIAYRMTELADGKISLKETMPAAELRDLSASFFPSVDKSDLVVMKLSVLVPHQLSARGAYTVSFHFRVLHEYFLALFMKAAGRSATGLPPGCRQMLQELADA